MNNEYVGLLDTEIYLRVRINKGSASAKSFCKSELYFVRYGQLFEHFKSLEHTGKKKT